MGKKTIIRVRPKTFDTDWRADLKAVGVTVPETVPEVRYTPVNHNPMPYSLAVNMKTRRLVQRIVGVIPNATYNGTIYPWEEFRVLLDKLDADKAKGCSPKEGLSRAD